MRGPHSFSATKNEGRMSLLVSVRGLGWVGGWGGVLGWRGGCNLQLNFFVVGGASTKPVLRTTGLALAPTVR